MSCTKKNLSCRAEGQTSILVSLQANNYNVEITADGVGEKAVDTMRLKLLKRTPGYVAIATFGGHAAKWYT